MFEKVSRAAEKVATALSRRSFLGRLGQGALVLAGTVGAFLALPGDAQAKACPRDMIRCHCTYKGANYRYCCPAGTRCGLERGGDCVCL